MRLKQHINEKDLTLGNREDIDRKIKAVVRKFGYSLDGISMQDSKSMFPFPSDGDVVDSIDIELTGYTDDKTVNIIAKKISKIAGFKVKGVVVDDSDDPDDTQYYIKLRL